MISSIKAPIFAVALSAVICAVPARADRVDQEKIVACMIEKTTPQDKEILRHAMFSALQGNTSELEKNASAIAVILTRISTRGCGFTTLDMDTPAFSQTMDSYAEKMGEILMGEALANLN